MAEGISDQETGVLAETAGGLIGASAALPFVGDPWVAQYVQAAVSPGAAKAVQRLIVGPILERVRARNLTAIVGMTAQSIGTDGESLAARINSDTHAARSFVEAARAAELTDSSEKLKALAEALVVLLTDPAQVDEEIWFIRQLAPIENYHLRVLSCWSLSPDEWDVLKERNGGDFGSGQVLIWSRSELEQRTELQMAGQLADELVRHGFLERTEPLEVRIDTRYDYESEPLYLRRPGGGHDAWLISALGTTLLVRVGGSRAWAGGGRRRDDRSSEQP